jgi:GntR family transcriptional regulator
MLALENAHRALKRLAGELTDRGEARMPTERALAERLGTSRTTVRKALELLESDGTIRRVKGRTGGAYLTNVAPRDASSHVAMPFCRSRGILRSLNTVKGIPQILHEQGFRDGTTVIRSGLVSPPSRVRTALGLTAAEPVVSLLRLRHADGETLSLEQMYLRAEVAVVLRTELKSVYDTLRSRLGVQICVADESIEVAAISPAEGALLGQPPGTPVLKVERTGYDQHGGPIEYSVDLFRADRTRLQVQSQSQISAAPI